MRRAGERRAVDGGLSAWPGHAADQLEVVDPDVGRARPAVDVQQHGVDIGFAAVDLRPKLHAQEVDLAG